jgi:hypothetical protein
LQRWRAGPRTCEQTEGVARVQAHHFCDQQTRCARRQHADQSDDVGPAAGTRAQREALDADLADEIPDRDHENSAISGWCSSSDWMKSVGISSCFP